ncbi:hypothetical protein [Paenibacillus dakarensis]|uniref:hypothetical protein n=1 Tax=Paenibacillus dakarensis TaxID=1527293 RepID=UPI0006D57176|nr:hypothetical protein [Paenibacillus dakarensis]
MRKKHLVMLLSVCLIVSVMVNCYSFFKIHDYKLQNNKRHMNQIDNFYFYGMEIPQFKIEKIMELINQDPPDAREGVETWLLEIASDYSVAENSLAATQIHPRLFFEQLKGFLLDMIRTEDDFEKWKQICLELNDITSYLKLNLSKDDLKDPSNADENWLKIMNEIKEKYAHTYLISNMSL